MPAPALTHSSNFSNYNPWLNSCPPVPYPQKKGGGEGVRKTNVKPKRRLMQCALALSLLGQAVLQAECAGRRAQALWRLWLGRHAAAAPSEAVAAAKAEPPPAE